MATYKPVPEPAGVKANPVAQTRDKILAAGCFFLFLVTMNSANVLFKYAFSGLTMQSYWEALAYLPFAWPIWAGIILRGFSVIFWFVVLSRFDLSFIYPLIAINFPIIQICGWFFFDEVIDPQRLVGIAFIIVGVVALYREKP